MRGGRGGGWWERVVRRAARIAGSDYRAHLTSERWAETRRLVLERSNGLCEGCRRARATQVHHLTYAHVGGELLFELVALCGDCHRRAEAPAPVALSSAQASRLRASPEPAESVDPPSALRGLIWADLMEWQPELVGLEAAVLASGRTCPASRPFCAVDAWFGERAYRSTDRGFKGRLSDLAGPAARDRGHRKQFVLETPEAYDVAYQHLYACLPACRGCGCARMAAAAAPAAASGRPPAEGVAGHAPPALGYEA